MRNTYDVAVRGSGPFLILTFPQLGEHHATQALTYLEIAPTARDYLAITLDIPADSFDLRIEVAESLLTGDYQQLGRIRKRWEDHATATVWEDPAIVAQHADTDIPILLGALHLPLRGPKYI